MTNGTEGKDSVRLEWPRADRSWHSGEVNFGDLIYTKKPTVQKLEAQYPEHRGWRV